MQLLGGFLPLGIFHQDGDHTADLPPMALPVLCKVDQEAQDLRFLLQIQQGQFMAAISTSAVFFKPHFSKTNQKSWCFCKQWQSISQLNISLLLLLVVLNISLLLLLLLLLLFVCFFLFSGAGCCNSLLFGFFGPDGSPRGGTAGRRWPSRRPGRGPPFGFGFGWVSVSTTSCYRCHPNITGPIMAGQFMICQICGHLRFRNVEMFEMRKPSGPWGWLRDLHESIAWFPPGPLSPWPWNQNGYAVLCSPRVASRKILDQHRDEQPSAWHFNTFPNVNE